MEPTKIGGGEEVGKSGEGEEMEKTESLKVSNRSPIINLGVTNG